MADLGQPLADFGHGFGGPGLCRFELERLLNDGRCRVVS